MITLRHFGLSDLAWVSADRGQRAASLLGDALASELADSLLSPGWYANWNSDTEATVVFPGKVFRYPRGDQAGREEAKAHGRSVGVPEPQLDWTD